MFDYNWDGERTVIISPHAYDEGVPRFPYHVRVLVPRSEMDYNDVSHEDVRSFYDQFRGKNVILLHATLGEGVDIGFGPPLTAPLYVVNGFRRIVGRSARVTLGRFPARRPTNAAQYLGRAVQLEVNNNIIRSREFRELIDELYKFFNGIRK